MGEMAMLKYHDKTTRLLSLSKWPKRVLLQEQQLTDIARTGFYFQLGDCDGEEGGLRCYCCGCYVADWQVNDNPFKVHATILPLCWHLAWYIGLDKIKMYIEDDEDGILIQQSQILSISGLIERCPLRRLLPITDTSANNLPPNVRLGGSHYTDGLAPVYPNFAESLPRSETFENVKHMFPPVPEMVAAGFYYEGNGYKVRCYFCGGEFVLRRRNDNPWIEHAGHAQNCLHVILSKGESFVKHTVQQQDIEMDYVDSIPILNGTSQKRMCFPCEKQCEGSSKTTVFLCCKIQVCQEVGPCPVCGLNR